MKAWQMPKSLGLSNSNMPNTWVTTCRIYFGPLHTKTLIVHCVTETHWPNLLSNCEHPYLKGTRIAQHNKAVHLITQTLQANKNTRFFTLTNACTFNNKPPEQTNPEWVLKCTCSQSACQCQAKLRPDILCIIGSPNQTQTLIAPSPTLTN